MRRKKTSLTASNIESISEEKVASEELKAAETMELAKEAAEQAILELKAAEKADALAKETERKAKAEATLSSLANFIATTEARVAEERRAQREAREAVAADRAERQAAEVRAVEERRAAKLVKQKAEAQAVADAKAEKEYLSRSYWPAGEGVLLAKQEVEARARLRAQAAAEMARAEKEAQEQAERDARTRARAARQAEEVAKLAAKEAARIAELQRFEAARAEEAALRRSFWPSEESVGEAVRAETKVMAQRDAAEAALAAKPASARVPSALDLYVPPEVMAAATAAVASSSSSSLFSSSFSSPSSLSWKQRAVVALDEDEDAQVAALLARVAATDRGLNATLEAGNPSSSFFALNVCA